MQKETRTCVLRTLVKSGNVIESIYTVNDDYDRNSHLIALWAIGKHKKFKGLCSAGKVCRPDGTEDKSYSFSIRWSAEDEEE